MLVVAFRAFARFGLGRSLSFAKRRPGRASDTYLPVMPRESTTHDLVERLRAVHIEARRSIGSGEGR